jgi:hypothetical protein
MDEYESLCHTKWECKYHVVFIPKCLVTFPNGEGCVPDKQVNNRDGFIAIVRLTAQSTICYQGADQAENQSGVNGLSGPGSSTSRNRRCVTGLCQGWDSLLVPAPDKVLISECSLNHKSNTCNKSVACVVWPLLEFCNGTEVKLDDVLTCQL